MVENVSLTIRLPRGIVLRAMQTARERYMPLKHLLRQQLVDANREVELRDEDPVSRPVPSSVELQESTILEAAERVLRAVEGDLKGSVSVLEICVEMGARERIRSWGPEVGKVLRRNGWALWKPRCEGGGQLRRYREAWKMSQVDTAVSDAASKPN
jgi:hypothetical protein